MTVLEKRKCMYIIERLNQEYELNQESKTFIKNLNQYFNVFGHDGETLMLLIKNIYCSEEQKQKIVSMMQDRILANGDMRYVFQLAKYVKYVDYVKLTLQMLRMATDSELIKLAQIKGIDVIAIANKFAYEENLKSLQELHKVVPLKFKKRIASDIKYLKEEGVVVSQY